MLLQLPGGWYQTCLRLSIEANLVDSLVILKPSIRQSLVGKNVTSERHRFPNNL